MNAKTYGRHFSGYQHKKPRERFTDRYPYTTGLLTVICFLTGFIYMSTHYWQENPWGMTIALVLFFTSLIHTLIRAARILKEQEQQTSHESD